MCRSEHANLVIVTLLYKNMTETIISLIVVYAIFKEINKK